MRRRGLRVLGVAFIVGPLVLVASGAYATPASPDRYGAPLGLNIPLGGSDCVESTALAAAPSGDVYGTASSVYHLPYDSGRNFLVRVRANAIDDSVELGAGRYPIDLTVGDDTVWVLTDNRRPGGASPTTAALGAVSRANLDDSVWVDLEPSQRTAVTSVDDTVYAVSGGTPDLLIVSGAHLDDSLTVTLPQVVNVVDMTARSDGWLQLASTDGSTSLASKVDPDDTNTLVSVPLAGNPRGIALSADDTTFVVYFPDRFISVIGSATTQIDDTIPFASAWDIFSIGVTPSADLIFLGATSGASEVHVINGTNPDDSAVFPSLSGGAATAVTGDKAIVGGSCEALFAVVDSTFMQAPAQREVYLGRLDAGQSASQDFVFTNTSANPVAVPPGTFDDTTSLNGTLDIVDSCSGTTVNVDDTCVVRLVATGRGLGGRGSVTVPSTLPLTRGPSSMPGDLRQIGVRFQGTAPAPTPAPTPVPTPATAPRAPSATAGDGSAAVAWSAPASSGTYPISTYEVIASPGGARCLAAALSCRVAGLANGTAYIFTVKALTGAGWSPASPPSNAVTPSAPVRPSILIAGMREGRQIVVKGRTVGMDPATTVTPHVARSTGEFEAGLPAATGVDGSLAWSRRASKAVVWRVYFTGSDGVKSNKVTIR